MYVLLTGKWPFKGNSKEKTFKKIKESEPNYSESCWKTITEEANDLVKKLLDKNHISRISSKVVFKHKWFDTIENNGTKGDIDSEEYDQTLIKLKNL